MAIRAVINDDWRELCHLFEQPGVRFNTLRMPFHKPEDIKRMVEERSSAGLSLVNVVDDRVVGCLFLYRHTGRRTHVADFWMAVRDDMVGQGIGTELLECMLDSADKWLGLRRIELTVYCDNDAAVELYSKHGFEIEGKLIGYAYRSGMYADALCMARWTADQA